MGNGTLDLRVRLPSRLPVPLTQGQINGIGVLPKGMTFKGEIGVGAEYHIAGHLQGRVVGNGHLVHVDAGASVDGDIQASAITVEGTVTGGIHCPSGYVRMTSTARVDATVHYHEIEVDLGALVRVRMHQVTPDNE